MKSLHIVIASAILVAATSLQAADTTGAPAANDPLAGAREHIAKDRWADAIRELQRINAVNSADWNNLMGYSLRKSRTPDLVAAERHYDAALKIDPRHRGALAYSGELYLTKGELPKAEERLAALDKVCLLPCQEYSDLKKSVERYKAGR